MPGTFAARVRSGRITCMTALIRARCIRRGGYCPGARTTWDRVPPRTCERAGGGGQPVAEPAPVQPPTSTGRSCGTGRRRRPSGRRRRGRNRPAARRGWQGRAARGAASGCRGRRMRRTRPSRSRDHYTFVMLQPFEKRVRGHAHRSRPRGKPAVEDFDDAAFASASSSHGRSTCSGAAPVWRAMTSPRSSTSSVGMPWTA